jgi:hypothetical protein
VRLAADVPEFAIWSQLGEHAATRTEVRRQTDTLDRLAELLASTVTAGTPAVEAEERLARHAAAVLHRPLWRASTQRPLIILGHPGAGKSLLTEVLAARLPSEAFTTIRVPLRAVNPDAPIHQQVEKTVEGLVKEHPSWGELCRASDTTKVVGSAPGTAPTPPGPTSAG